MSSSYTTATSTTLYCPIAIWSTLVTGKEDMLEVGVCDVYHIHLSCTSQLTVLQAPTTRERSQERFVVVELPSLD